MTQIIIIVLRIWKVKTQADEISSLQLEMSEMRDETDSLIEELSKELENKNNELAQLASVVATRH